MKTSFTPQRTHPQMLFAGLLALCMTTSCSLEPYGTRDGVDLTLKFKKGNSLPSLFQDPFSFQATPTGITGFDCFGVNVIGEGIPSLDGNIQGLDIGALYAGVTGCSYPGILGGPVQLTSSPAVVSVIVPPGPARLIQVAGIVDDGTLCSGNVPLNEAIQQNEESDIEVYEVGRVVEDIFDDKVVGILENYNSANPLRMDCNDEGPVLDLVEGHYGYHTGGSPFGNTVSSAAVGANLGNALTAAQMTLLESSNNASPIIVGHSGGTGQHAEIQFVFDATSFPLGTFNGITVKATVAGGTYSGTCGMDIPDGGTGARIKVWKDGGTPGWSANSHQTSSFTTEELYVDTSAQLTSEFTTTLSGTWTSAGDHVVVSIQSIDDANGQCATLAVYSVRLSLIP